MTPLHLAADSGHLAMVDYFVNIGVDRDAKSNFFRSAIHWAVHKNHPTIVRYLAIRHADVECYEEPKKRKPLHTAAENGFKEILLSLINFGANINCEDEEGQRPIHVAAWNKQAEIVHCLIGCGADIECVTKWMSRPIHWSCAMNDVDTLKHLLSAGSLIDVKDMYGNLPIDGANTSQGYDYREKLMEEKKSRATTEFSIWHFKNFVVAWRCFKIYDFPFVAEQIKSVVHPIKKTVVFCDLPCFKDQIHNQANLVVMQIRFPMMSFPEFVVLDENGFVRDLVLLLNTSRNWNISVYFPGTKEPVPLDKEIKQLKTTHSSLSLELGTQTDVQNDQEEVSWNHLAVSVKFTDYDKSDKSISSLSRFNMLCHGDTTCKALKGIVIAFVKIGVACVVRHTMQTDRFIHDQLLCFLKRLVMNRPYLLNFHYQNGILFNSKTMRELTDESIFQISVSRKWNLKIRFIPPAIDENVKKFVGQEFIVVKPVVEDQFVYAILCSHCPSVGQAKMELKKRLGLEWNLELLDNYCILSDEQDTREIHHVVDYAAYETKGISKLPLIGRGAFGEVYKYQDERSETFALKLIDSKLDKNNPTVIQKDILKEIVAISKIPPHDRLIKYDQFYVHVGMSSIKFYMRMPFMEHGSLCKYLKKHSPLSEWKITVFSKQILQGLQHLHDHKVIHRDLKGSNVLLDKDDNAKIADYGLSKYLVGTASSRIDQGPVSQAGTANYLAPELLNDSVTFGIKSDIWSFGATVIEMITGKPPYANLPEAKVVLKVFKEKRIDYDFPENLPNNLKRFVARCLDKNPARRPNCKTLLDDTIFGDRSLALVK